MFMVLVCSASFIFDCSCADFTDMNVKVKPSAHCIPWNSRTPQMMAIASDYVECYIEKLNQERTKTMAIILADQMLVQYIR